MLKSFFNGYLAVIMQYAPDLKPTIFWAYDLVDYALKLIVLYLQTINYSLLTCKLSFWN